MVNPETCPNCQSPLTKMDQFCPSCGQKARLPRITSREIVFNIVHSFTDTRGLSHLIINLTHRPGLVARDYVTGKRSTYFPPFSFLILVVGVTSLLLGESHVISHQTNMEGVNKASFIGNFMDAHANLIIFLNVPILAFFNHLLFRKSGFNYAEHLVMTAFISGMKSIFFSLLVMPFLYFFPEIYFKIVACYMVCWVLYFSWANLQFTQSSGLMARLKGFLVPVLSQLGTVVLVILIMLLYFGKEAMLKNQAVQHSTTN